MFDLFSQQTLFGEGVAGVVRHGVDGSLLHLVLDGFEQDEQRRPGAVFQVVVHGQGHPVGEHLLHDGFGAAQHQLRVFGADRLVHQPEEQRAQYRRRVLHVAHQRHHQQRSHVHPNEKSHCHVKTRLELVKMT